MASEPTRPPTFTEAYYQALIGGSGTQPSQIGEIERPFVGEQQKLGFLGRTVDILSRPMRIISNPAMKAVELPERMDTVKELRAAGDTAAATKESLNAVGSLLASPFTGFFSDDPSNKPYWSDIIERQADVVNRNDPNYVDVANNIDPKIKGALGFVGDVLIDPLWLVPGGWALKGAKEGAKEGAEAAARGITVGQRTGVPGAVEIVSGGKFNPDLKVFGAPEAYNLITRVGNQTKKQTFPTRQAAETALNKLRSRKGSRPWVEAGSAAPKFRGTNTYSIAPVASFKTSADAFPAAQAAQKVSDDLVENVAKGGATASETVVNSLRQIVDNKTAVVGGKKVNLKEEVGGFFKSLATIVSPTKTKPGKVQPFQSWTKALLADKALAKTPVAIPQSSVFISNGFDRTASIEFLVDLQKNTRNIELKDAITTQLLRPAYESYRSGVKAGKGVDLLGNAATPTARMQEAAEASVAAVVVRNLKNLDDAERARGAALLGEELFIDLQTMSPKAMTRFLDEINAVLYKTGSLDSLGLISDQSFAGRFLKLFDIDSAARLEAAEQVARAVDNIPNVTPETTIKAAENISRNVQTQEDIISTLRAEGYSENQIPSLADAIMETLEAALPGPIKKKIATDREKFKFESKTGVLNTKAAYGEGVGVRPFDPNTYFQFDTFLSISKHLDKTYLRSSSPKALQVLKNAQGQMPKGSLLAAEKERLVLATMKIAENFLIGRGVALTFDLNGVYKQMRFTQAYETVRDVLGESGKRFIRVVFFHGGPTSAKLPSGMAPTQFMEAVSQVLAGGNKEDVLKLLTSAKDTRTGKDITKINFLARPKETTFMMPLKLKSSDVADKLADAIVAAREALETISANNATKFTALGQEQAKIITPDAAESILDLLNNPIKFAESIRVVAYSGDVVGDLGKAINANELGTTLAAGTIQTSLGENITKGARLVDELANASSTMNGKKISAAQTALLDDAITNSQRLLDEARKVADDVGGQLADDLKAMTESNIARPLDGVATEGYGTVMAFLLKVSDPLRRFFDAKYGMHTKELLWGSRMFYATMNTMSFVNKPYLKSLKKLMEDNRFSKPLVAGSKTTVLQQAINNVQKGIKSTEGTVLREAEDQIRPMLARFFDMSDDIQKVLLGNAFFRTGAGWDAINSTLSYNTVTKTPPAGVFFDYDLALENAAKVAKKPGAPTQDEIMQSMLEQWRTWEIDDPIDFMYRINRAMVQLSAEVGFVTGFKRKAIETGVGSYIPQKGFVKIVVDGDSRYGKFLGDEPFYMTPDGAEMFQAIDNLAKSSKQFEGGFGKFVRTTLDPITDTWKYAITLPRLGHHIRNMTGDLTLTYLAEGIFGSAVAARKAWEMMSFRGSYPDIDMVKAMSFNGITEIPKSGKVMSSGQVGSFSAEELWQDLIIKRGILIPARQSEGLLKSRGFTPEDGVLDDTVTNTVSVLLEKGLGVASLGIAARGGKAENFWTGLSEGRDSYVRLQHALQILEKAQAGKKITRGYGMVVDPKKLSKDELFDIISERVSKYHPDMSTLAVPEKKYLRRLMPFYHWNRGAIQAVTETLLMNPGRVVALNKASYNIAVAAGINPDSLYNPFPDDQLFPSFLQNQMEGPLFEMDGSYFGVRPGIATFDVMNQFASGNPLDTVLDNANPAFKIPIELLTGTRLGTQSRIRDYSDYLDSAVPGVNYISNISGQSVTGSLYSLLTGGGFDPQYQFEVGNKDARDQTISALNWLLGIGLTDYSRPSYIRFAEIEQQQKNREDRGF